MLFDSFILVVLEPCVDSESHGALCTSFTAVFNSLERSDWLHLANWLRQVSEMRVWYENTIYLWPTLCLGLGLKQRLVQQSAPAPLFALSSLLLFTSILLLPAYMHLIIRHLLYEGPCCSKMTWLFVRPGLFMWGRKEIFRSLVIFKVTVTVLKQVHFML